MHPARACPGRRDSRRPPGVDARHRQERRVPVAVDRVELTPTPAESAIATDHSYGVAGSPVLPITRIGGAPSASPMIRGSIGSGPPIQPVDARRKSSNHCVLDAISSDSTRTASVGWPDGVVGAVDREPCVLAVVVAAVAPGDPDSCRRGPAAASQSLSTDASYIPCASTGHSCVVYSAAITASCSSPGVTTRSGSSVGMLPCSAIDDDERRVHLERRADRRKVAVGVGVARFGELLERPVEARCPVRHRVR